MFRIRRILEARRLPLWMALAAFALASPGLIVGFQVDDHFLRMALSDPPVIPEWSRTPFDLFAFFAGEQGFVHAAADGGAVPWWAREDLRLAFFRPVTGLTHWLDFKAWPTRPWLMHLHSLLWFAAAVAAATALYRRLLTPVWIGGFAALLFAVDDGHGWPAVWIANRNASIAVCFALLAIVAHDRARRDGRLVDVATPLLLLVALLAGEIAAGALGYFVAYALFLDPGRPLRRLVALLPSLAVAIVWMLAYRANGFGAAGSSMYIDPGAQPAAFARALGERAPLLLSGQWALPSELHLLLSEPARPVLWLAACALVVGAAALLAPLVRRSAVSRFFAAGMLMAAVPACATFPADRLMFLAGFGGLGLLAQWLGAVGEPAAWMPAAGLRRAGLRAIAAILVVVNLGLAPLGLLSAGQNLQALGSVCDRAAASYSAIVTGQEARVLIVNTPSAFISAYGPLAVGLERRAVPPTTVLSSGIYSVRLRRIANRELSVRPELGFYPPPGAIPPDRAREAALVDRRYVFMLFDGLYRDTPIARGTRIRFSEMVVEVTEVTADGRPAEVVYRFDHDLTDPRYRWLQWRDGVYAALTLPEVGRSVVLPPVVVP
jgi:hypothetical protein